MEIFSFKVDKFDGVKPNLIYDGKSTKEICISMQNGSIMKEHTAPDDIIVQVLKGEINFSVNGDSYRLAEFEMLGVKAKTPHSLIAIKDSIIRLTLSKSDNFSRVVKLNG